MLGAALALGGCTGTDGSTSGMTTTTDASATGIWGGTDSATGLSVIGYVNSAGDAVFMRADGAQYAGPTQVSGETLVAAGRLRGLRQSIQRRLDLRARDARGHGHDRRYDDTDLALYHQ